MPGPELAIKEDRPGSAWRAPITPSGLGVLMVLGAAVCFGTMPTFAKLAYSHGADAYGLLAIRFWFGSIAIIGFLLIVRGLPSREGDGVRLVLLATIFSIQSFCFFEALARTSTAVAVLLLYTYPLLVTIGAAAFLGEELTRGKAAVLALGFVGVALTLGGVRGALDPLGVVLAFLSGLLFAVFMTLSKVGMRAERDPLDLVATIYTGAGFCYVVVLATHGISLPADLAGWSSLGGVLLVGTIASMVLFFSGLSRLPAGVTSMLSTLEPAVSVSIAAAVLGEAISVSQWLGIGLVLTSIALLGLLVVRMERRATDRRVVP